MSDLLGKLQRPSSDASLYAHGVSCVYRPSGCDGGKDAEKSEVHSNKSGAMPSGGASRLPKNPLASQRRIRCDVCSSTQVKTWCKTCEVIVCNDHTLAHLAAKTRSGKAEHTTEFFTTSEEASRMLEQSAASTPDVCPDHGNTLVYICTDCDQPACGDCLIIGGHQGHKGVKASAIVSEKKQKVSQGVAKLTNDVQPRLVRSIQAVDDVTSTLTTRTGQVRDKIEKAAQKVVDTAQACSQKLLQDMDDIEQARTKVLNQQRDGLQQQLDAAQGAAGFGEEVVCEVRDNDETCLPLLVAVEQRITAICGEEIEDEPKRHANISFEAPDDDVVVAQCMTAIGTVLSCEASAAHSTVQHDYSQRVIVGDILQLTLVAKDNKSQPINCPGDVIKTKWLSCPSGARRPAVDIAKAESPGHYTITTRPTEIGDHQLEISLNSKAMPQPVSITVWPNHTFDPEECNPSITLSADRCSAKLDSNAGQTSVLGAYGMRHGCHSWKIQIGAPAHWHGVGIAAKPLRNNTSNFNHSLSWSSTQQRYGPGHDGTPLTNWQDNDCVLFELDCDQHTLKMRNLRSGESHTITGLPDKEFSVYVNIFERGSSASFVP